MPKRPKNKPRGQHGQVGPQTVEAVDKLVAEGLKRTKAFAEVAKATGRKPSTIAVTYYKHRARSGGSTGKDSRSTPRTVAAVVSRVQNAVKDLAAVLRRQEREIARLRTEAEWGKRLRKLLKK